MVKSTAQITGDKAITYAILTDFNKYIEWYPECLLCEVISTSGSTVDVNLTLGGMKVAKMVLRYDCQPDSITYDMVSSNDLKGFKGSYRIVDGGGGSHTLNMEVDLSASVPKFITDRMMKTSLETQGKQVQARNTRFAAATSAQPAGAAAVSAPTSAPVATVGAARASRPRCLLRVRKSGADVHIWYAGAEFLKAK